jgi:peptidoglycan biosynthesis protein MviN/MurJ (putative lipid II flippase)
MSSTRPLLRAETSLSHSSAVVSVSLLVAALLGAGQALLLAFIEGESDKTDAFLAAYALYVVFAIFGGSLRASVVPLVRPTDSEAGFQRQVSELVSRILGIALAAFVLLLVASPALGQALTFGLPADARWTAVFSLMILAPAAFCQIYAATLSATLTAARRFAFSSGFYVLSGAVSLGCSAALISLFGVLGAAVGLLVGAIMVLAGHILYLRSFGVRFRPRLSRLGDRAQRELAMLLVAGAAVAVAFQANLAISLAVISDNPGAITAYTYAFFMISLFLSISGSSLALVTLPELVARIAREGVAAAPKHLQTVAPYMFAVLVPLLVGFVAFGQPVVSAVFEDSLSSSTADLIYDVGVLLCVMAIPCAVLFLTTPITLALGRSKLFLGVGLASVLAHAAIVISLSSLGTRAVAAGHIASSVVLTCLLLAVTFGKGWPMVALRALGRSLPAAAFASVFVLLRLPLGSDPGLGGTFVFGALSALAYAALVVMFWPQVSAGFRELLRRPTPPAGSVTGVGGQPR